MQLKLTWKIAEQNRSLDILVSDEQKIIETMRVLLDKGLLTQEKFDSATYVKSLRTNTQVNLLLTYKEGQIYSGDILQV